MHPKGIFLLLGFACLFSILKAGNIHQSCKTQCGDSCCPHENGVCCESSAACCRQGQTCLSNTDTCIGLRYSAQGNVSLYSEKAYPVSGLYCPSGTTPCEGGCCPYEDGVCCNDGYCCPQGYACTNTSCVMDGISNKSLRKGLARKDPENNIMGRKLKDLGIQICPDKLHLCPGSAECCRKNNGEWDCCPKIDKLKSGECCSIWGIYTCCTDLVPKCHWWGCWFS